MAEGKNKKTEVLSEAEQITKTYDLKYQTTVHSVAACFLLLIGIIAIAAFVVTLSKSTNAVNTLIDLKPENRVEVFSNKIKQAFTTAETQYNQQKIKMEDSDIFSVSNKFKTLYTLSLESEQDNTRLLESYQQIIFQVASKTNGSGEWYEFYASKLNKFVRRNQKRATGLQRYVHEDTSEVNKPIDDKAQPVK